MVSLRTEMKVLTGKIPQSPRRKAGVRFQPATVCKPYDLQNESHNLS